MVREIVKDMDALTKRSLTVKKDVDGVSGIITDMLDTVRYHEPNCCGLAAVQIGYNKRIILVRNSNKWLVMINPVITKKSKRSYSSTESCLSLPNIEGCTHRHYDISVLYLDIDGESVFKRYNGMLAQIIQHEVDHLDGILIGGDLNGNARV